MLRPHVCKLWLLSLPLTLGVLGCATTPPLTTTVSLPMPDPQSTGQLANVHKIAVMDITGPVSPLGEMMAGTLSARLATTGRFTVTDRPTILRTGFNPEAAQNGVTLETASEVGTRVGADAVLIGEASFSLGDIATTPPPPNGAQMLTGTPAPKPMLTVNYRLIDPKTKQTLLSDRQQLALDTPPSNTPNRLPGQSGPEEKQQMLAEQFAAKVMERMVSPAKRPMPREFAVDLLGLATDTTISRGNRFAACGAIDEAAHLYMQALQEKPDCHEANYNLGLLAESKGELPYANQYFAKAMAAKACPLYIQAYQRTKPPQS